MAPQSEPDHEMKVLALGLPRSGTVSIAEALNILGYHNVYHSLKTIGRKEDWRVFSRAADACFPTLPTFTGEGGFTRSEWDAVYGPYEAATDTAGIFGPHVVRAYPNAKVLLVKRDFEKWFTSIDEMVIKGLWSPLSAVFVSFVHPLLGLETITAMRKATLGFFEARDVAEIRRNARVAYERHHREIQEIVPPGQLLVYELGQGWEPLCKFLGKPVPAMEFPWLNEADELRAVTVKLLKSHLSEACTVLLKWALLAGVLSGASYMLAERSGILDWHPSGL